MSTPVSPSTPYCTPQDLVARYDVRSIGDRLQDAGIRVSPADVLRDPNLYALLLQASGMLEAAVLRGQRYKVTDLQLLVTRPDLPPGTQTTGGEFVKGIVADVTIYLIFSRRITIDIPKQAKDAMELLDAIAGGERIFALDEVASAGLKMPIVAPNQDQPVAPKLPVPVTSRTRDYFGNLLAG